MYKKKSPNGLIYYEATALETAYLGGFGICDDCGKYSETGYLVPVLNHYQCPCCFEEFIEFAKHYPEDDIYELETSLYFESMIPCVIEN